MNADDVSRIRAKTGKSQKAFAKMLGRSERAIAGWEGSRGDMIPESMQLLLETVEAVYNADENAMIILRAWLRSRFENSNG